MDEFNIVTYVRRISPNGLLVILRFDSPRFVQGAYL